MLCCWQPRVFAHRKYLTFLTFDAKSNVLRVVKLKVTSVHLLIYTGIGNLCLPVACCCRQPATVVSDQQCNSKNALI